MTIAITTAKSRFAGDGSTTSFPTGFKFLHNGHVRVLLLGGDGSETLWAEGSEFSLSGVGAPGGGTVTVSTSPTDYTPQSGDTLVIKLAIPAEQQTALPLGGTFPSTAVEGMADLAALRDQQLEEALSRAVKFKETTALADVAYPEPEAGKVARWNAAGDALENSDLPTFLDGSGAPAGSLGKVDDRYIDNVSGAYYKKTGASTWSLTGNFEGPAGPQGLQGAQGIQGIQGPAGADGSDVLFGFGAPAGGTGVIGDYYKNTDNGDFYEKTGASAWTLRGNDTGPQGPTGDTGATGPQGPAGADGSDVLFGSGAPAGGTGVIGDYYKNTDNGDFHEKTGASSWTLRGNDTGPQGATGATGPQGPAGNDGIFSAIASQAEAEAATENTKGMTPLRVAQAISAQVNQALVVAAGDETAAITAGNGKITFRMPFAFTLSAVRASLTTAGTTLTTVDVNESGTSILSTKLTIDANEKTSETAATAAVISDTVLADDAEMTIDIDGAGTNAAGLKVTLIGRPA